MNEQAASLLQLVSRFTLDGGEADMAALQVAAPRPAAPRPRPARRAAPAPIKVRREQPRLTSGFGALGPSQKHSGSGEWQEF